MAALFPEFFQKIMSIFLPLVLLITGVSAKDLDYSDKLGDENYIGLQEKYDDYFYIGTCTSSWQLAGGEVTDFVLKNFNSVTPESEMKQPWYNPAPGVFVHTEMDKIADFCRANNFRMRGHTLAWPGLSDSWIFYEDDGVTFVSKEKLIERYTAYIEDVMLRYGDIIDDWDIANEVFNFNAAPAFKQDNPLFTIWGEDYVKDIINIACKYKDDNDKFFLNETKILNNTAKERHTFKYIEKWIKEGVKIDGIGIEGHWETVSINENPFRLRKILDRCKDLGLEVQITEFDLTMYNSNDQERYPTIPKWLETWQINDYYQFFKIFREYKDLITSVSFWGICDANTRYTRNSPDDDFPMLFDKNMKPKQNFYAVCDF